MSREWVTRAAALSQEVLLGRPGPRVAVIQRGDSDEIRAALADHIGDATVTCHNVVAGVEGLHVELAAHGPYDLVLDVAGGRGAGRRFRALFFHANVGGHVVARRPAPGQDDLVPYVEQALRLGAAARPPRGPFDPRPRDEADLHALAASMVHVRVLPRFVVARNQTSVLAKIPERLADAYCARTSRHSRVLTTVPARTWPSPCKVRGSDPQRAAALPRSFEGPALSVREHRGVICLPHSGVYAAGVVLPDTYRRLQNRPRSTAVVDWGQWFARAPRVEAEQLPGRYFHLDNEWRGHFGHLMVEQLSKLWAWRWAKQQDPGLRALIFERPDSPVRPWELDLLAAGGVPQEDIVVAAQPVMVDELVTGSPAYSTPEGLHPVLGLTYADLGAALDLDDQGEWPDRVFLSRRRTHQRWCHNAGEVEDLMRSAGFRVVYPEDHHVTVQATLVRRARVIAGFSGSGMFNVALAGASKRVVVIGSESYTAINEYRLSSFLGHHLDMVWCRADVPRGDRFSRAAFKSDFTYDDAREGRFLRQVLEDLPA